MSEIAFLAQRYNNVSTLLETVNHSVELLKISHYELSGFEQIKEEELLDARNFLARVVSTLIVKKNSDPFAMMGELATSLSEESSERLANIRHRSASILEEDVILQISPTYIKYLRKQRKKTLNTRLKSMRNLKFVLENALPLSKETLQDLDRLCFDLDAEATRIFHHLRRV